MKFLFFKKNNFNYYGFVSLHTYVYNNDISFSSHLNSYRYDYISVFSGSDIEFYKEDFFFLMSSMYQNVRRFSKIKYINNQHLSVKRHKNIPPINRFLMVLMRHGLKIKYLNYLNTAISDIYFSFFYFDKQISSVYGNYMNAINFVSQKFNFFKISTILNFLIALLEPFFFLKFEKIQKKYKKKYKKNFIAKVVYIRPHKRLNLVLRALMNYISLFSQFELSNRLSSSLLKTIVENKTSFLYKRKIFMYNKVFKKFQKKVF